MPDFRCDMLDERGGILFSADITAEALEGAIRHASDVLQTSNRSSSSRRVYAFEVWSGTIRLFPPQLHPAVRSVASLSPTRPNGAKLIVVDDDQDVRSLVADFLSDAGYWVLQAEGGARALVLITDDSSLRVMISDIRMPQMSGIELAEEAVRRRPNLRIILISGFTDRQPTQWPFLRKPFRMSKLGDLVAREMGQA